MREIIRKNMSISTKLTAFYSILLIAILVIVSITMIVGLNFVFINQAQNQISKTYDSIKNYGLEGNNLDWDMFDDIQLNSGVVVKIYKDDRTILDTGYKTPYYDITDEFNVVLSIQSLNSYVLYQNGKIDTDDGTYYIQVIKNMKEYSKFTRVLILLLVIVNILGVIFSLIIGNFLSSRMLKPVEKVTKMAQNITAENLKERIKIGGPDDEIKALANTFNDMLDRIDTHINQQQRFASDASHELRTPLAVIQGYVDLLAIYGNKDEELLLESVESIQGEISSMTRLIEQLLYLTRRDSGLNPLEMEEIDLEKIVKEVYEETELVDETHELVLEHIEDSRVYGNSVAIKQLIRILVDNARKYTLDGGQIKISLYRYKAKGCVTVEDTGIGMSEEDCNKVFNRFFRAEESRSKEMGGTGLGLSIAKSIIDEHKGEIKVESELGKGTKFTVLI
ncbi:MAG: HAMP domain-containing histidine kinase [Tissierellales bacterium]|nr:HAMP domain-containing histidine kinase [Tissierellales bacterium]